MRAKTSHRRGLPSFSRRWMGVSRALGRGYSETTGPAASAQRTRACATPSLPGDNPESGMGAGMACTDSGRKCRKNRTSPVPCAHQLTRVTWRSGPSLHLPFSRARIYHFNFQLHQEKQHYCPNRLSVAQVGERLSGEKYRSSCLFPRAHVRMLWCATLTRLVVDSSGRSRGKSV